MRLLTFVANPIIPFRNVTVTINSVSRRILPITLSLCAVRVQQRWIRANGMVPCSIVAPIFSQWKRNWEFAMPSIRNNLGMTANDLELHLFEKFCRSINGPKLSMLSNKYTGPGKLNLEVLTEANVNFYVNALLIESKIQTNRGPDKYWFTEFGATGRLSELALVLEIFFFLFSCF